VEDITSLAAVAALDDELDLLATQLANLRAETCRSSW
jgi:hypothetical protein